MVSTRSGGRAPAEEAEGENAAGIATNESFLDQLVHGVMTELAKEQSADMTLDRAGPGPAAGSSDMPDLEGLHWKPEVRLPGIPQAGEPSTSLPSGTSLAKQLTLPTLNARKAARAAKTAAPDTTGKSWFDMTAPKITDEVKKDLQMLRLRSAFDPKTFYKKFDRTKFPKYFQMGTVVESSAEYYSSRLSKAERKQTFAEEIAANSYYNEARTKRFNKLQAEKAGSGRRGRKTSNERLKKKARRPKH